MTMDQRQRLARIRRRLVDTWWGSYLGVLLIAALVGLLLLLVFAAHAAEILRALRSSAG